MPWHVDDGCDSHRRLSASIEQITSHAKRKETAAFGDEDVGRIVTGWGPFMNHRDNALALYNMDLVLN